MYAHTRVHKVLNCSNKSKHFNLLGRDIHREFKLSRKVGEEDKVVLQQIVADRFLYAQRVYGRQLMKVRGTLSHQQMKGVDTDKFV